MSFEIDGPGPGSRAGPYGEDELLPVSGLSHMVFCKRRWALIHLEGIWADNRHTAEGSALHAAVDQGGSQLKDGLVVARSLRLRSTTLGLVGVSDVVEFHPLPSGQGPDEGCTLPGRPGRWRPVPVEHKRGRPQPDDCYHVQLAGQALCLEEMTNATVERGYLYHAAPRRRQAVDIDPALRQRVRQVAAQMHALHTAGRTPPAVYHKKCRACSLLHLCLPQSAARGKSASRHLSAGLAAMMESEE